MQEGGALEVSPAHVGLGRIEPDRTILGDADHHPLTGRTMECEAGHFQVAQGQGKGTAGIGLLYAAGQRTLAADAEAIGIGEIGSRERPGGEDQRVPGRQWIDGRYSALEQSPGYQISPRPGDRLAMQFFDPDFLIVEIYVQEFPQGFVPVRLKDTLPIGNFPR